MKRIKSVNWLRIVLSGDPMTCNAFENPEMVAPRRETFAVSNSFEGYHSSVPSR